MTTDQGGGGFTVERMLGARPDRVFAAFVEPEKLEHWFVVEGFTTPAERMRVDARRGGRVEAVMVADDGTEVPFGFEYAELDPPDRLVLRFTDPREEITVRLREVDGDDTALTYEYMSWPAPEDTSQRRQGVETMLDAIHDGIARGII